MAIQVEQVRPDTATEVVGTGMVAMGAARTRQDTATVIPRGMAYPRVVAAMDTATAVEGQVRLTAPGIQALTQAVTFVRWICLIILV